MIVDTVVYLRYKLGGSHHELWVKIEDAKHVRKHLEAQVPLFTGVNANRATCFLCPSYTEEHVDPRRDGCMYRGQATGAASLEIPNEHPRPGRAQAKLLPCKLHNVSKRQSSSIAEWLTY